MNAYNDQKWILNIIQSCNNAFHFEGADALIRLFSYKYSKVPRFDSLLYDLIDSRNKQWNLIHSILK